MGMEDGIAHHLSQMLESQLELSYLLDHQLLEVVLIFCVAAVLMMD